MWGRAVYSWLIMKMKDINYLAAAMVLVGAHALGGDTKTETYLDTAFGWNPYEVPDADAAALRAAMQPHEQHVRRFAGVPTHAHVLQRKAKDNITMGAWEWFPSSPQNFMPYLDGLLVPGNTCVEPSWLLEQDALSTAAQCIKSSLGRYGFQYDLTLTMG